MTLDFYSLKEEPFGFLPDARFLYLTPRHRQAVASLLRALQAGQGYVMLLAQSGLGKTTLLFHTLNSFGDSVSTVYLFQAPRTPNDLLRTVLTDLGVGAIDFDEEGMFAQLREVLLQSQRLGKRVVIVIDEAQKLDPPVFDLLCALSNIVTHGARLIQFILCGQPVLADRLAASRPTQSMECGAIAHLEPFSAQDTAEYADHRLRTAGYRRASPLFTADAAALVARYSKGTPRTINHLCFEALSTAYAYRRERIGADTVQEAAIALDLAPPQEKTIVGSPVPAPNAAAHLPVRDASRVLPQPATPALTSREEDVPFLSVWPHSRKQGEAKAEKTPEKLKDRKKKRPAAAARQLGSPLAKAKKKAAAAPVGRLPARPAVAGSLSQPGKRSQRTAGKAEARPALALASAKAQQKLKALPKVSVPALGRGAVTSKSFIALPSSQATAAKARRIQVAVRSLVTRPRPGLTIAAVLLVTVTAAVFNMYRAQTVHSAGKPAMAASPLAYGSVTQRYQAPLIVARKRKAAPAAIPQVHAGLEPSGPHHDLKGMDLQTALRALSTRKQRQQQYQAANNAAALH